MAKKLTINKLRDMVRESIGEMIGFHGTGANFGEFDDQHVSSGAGSQYFGWGTYIASSEKIGRDYAKMARTKALYFRGEKVYDAREYEKQQFKNPYRLIFDLFDTERTFKNTKVRAERLLNMVDADNIEMQELWGKVVKILKTSRAIDWKVINEKILLTVSIPDDERDNYLDWYGFIEDKDKHYIFNNLYRTLTDPKKYGNEYQGYAGEELYKELQRLANIGHQMGGEIYKDLSYYCGGDKWASIFLNEIGFTGIKYKAGTINGGARKGDVNYVIFNPKDIQIINREIR